MAIAQGMKWAAVIKGLRMKGFSDAAIARYAETTEENIGHMAKGRMDPSATTGMMLRRMEFKTRAVPRVVPPKPAAERGVYEDDIALPGYRAFKVVTSEGKIGRVEMPLELIDPDFVQNLIRRLDARDPVTKLKAI